MFSLDKTFIIAVSITGVALNFLGKASGGKKEKGHKE
jgi:hypothetical protein